MSEALSHPVVLDATVLSDYASTDSVSWLTTTLDELQTVPAVRTELEQARKVGYDYLDHVLRRSKQDVFGLLRLHRNSPERTIRRSGSVETLTK